jgi:hypothetical protein
MTIPVNFRLELEPLRPRASDISPEMLAAGRAAFLRKRKQLDDLWDFFDDDLTAFLCAIFLAMHKHYQGRLN